MSDIEELAKQFADAVAKDPGLIDRLKKSESLNSFKDKYQVKGASPFKCPSCAALMQSPGTLWGPMKDTNNKFVCRKCKLEWELNLLNGDIEDLSTRIKEAVKGEGR